MSYEIFIWEVVFSIYYRIGFLFFPSLAFRIISFITYGGRICVSDSLLLPPTSFEDYICLLEAVYLNSFICLVMFQAFRSSIQKLVFCLSSTLSLSYSFSSFYLPSILVSQWMYELLGVLSPSIILEYEPLSLPSSCCLICFDDGLASFSNRLSSFYRKSILRLDDDADATCLGMDCLIAFISFIISFILDSYSLFLLQYSSMLVLEGECLQGEIFAGEASLYCLDLFAFGVIQWRLSFATGLKKLFLAETLSQPSLKVFKRSSLLVVTFS